MKLSPLIKANLDFGINLNLGCGFNHIDDFLNIDKFIENNPDLIFDLECDKPLPFDDNTVGFVYGSHIIEHVRNIFRLFRELYRVCKNGAECVFITPYATSFDAFESLDHCRLLNENSWMYLDKITNEGCAYAIDFNFKVKECVLVPHLEFLTDPELDFKRKHYWNIIKEMRTTLEVKK